MNKKFRFNFITQAVECKTGSYTSLHAAKQAVARVASNNFKRVAVTN